MTSTDSTRSSLRPFGGTLLVRTDYDDLSAWERIRGAATEPSDPEGFLANVQIIDDPYFRDLLPPVLLSHIEPDPTLSPYFFFVADKQALAEPGGPLLVVPIPYDPEYAPDDELPRSEFRVVATRLWSVENNLSLHNMDWSDFADSVDEDGVHRGF